MSSELKDTLADLASQSRVLEFLLPQNLFAFLATSDQIRHDLVGGAKWNVFVDFVAVFA